MATTSTRARPATDCGGTIGLVKVGLLSPSSGREGRGPRGGGGGGCASSATPGGSETGARRGSARDGLCDDRGRDISLIRDLELSVEQDQPARIDLIHQPDIVGRDDDGGAEPI